jgi:hypothetical protein
MGKFQINLKPLAEGRWPLTVEEVLTGTRIAKDYTELTAVRLHEFAIALPGLTIIVDA